MCVLYALCMNVAYVCCVCMGGMCVRDFVWLCNGQTCVFAHARVVSCAYVRAAWSRTGVPLPVLPPGPQESSSFAAMLVRPQRPCITLPLDASCEDEASCMPRTSKSTQYNSKRERQVLKRTGRSSSSQRPAKKVCVLGCTCTCEQCGVLCVMCAVCRRMRR